MIKVGLDAKRIVRNSTGLGAYGRTLVNDIVAHAPEDIKLSLYAPDRGKESLRSQIAACGRVGFVYPDLPFGFQRSLWRIGSSAGGLQRNCNITHDLQRANIDVYHGLTGELPRGLRNTGIRSVVTIHDLIFMRHPEYYHWIDTKIYTWKFRNACREADRIIAISECTKRDIMQLGGVSADRIDVIYQSCNPRYARPLAQSQLDTARSSCRLPGRFILSVGTIEERKNILLAAQALHSLPPDVHLVAVGRPTGYAARVLAYAAKTGISERIHFLSGVTDEELQAIYQLAEAFVYPSRYEGFGIPIIEAIHSGLPVVACTGSCLEEAGGPYSLYVSPDDAAGMADALSKVLQGAAGREERIHNSCEYVKRFAGTDVAGQVIRIYRELAQK